MTHRVDHLGILSPGTCVAVTASTLSVVDKSSIASVPKTDPTGAWNNEYSDVVVVGLILNCPSL